MSDMSNEKEMAKLGQSLDFFKVKVMMFDLGLVVGFERKRSINE